jgi:hypothetical protein
VHDVICLCGAVSRNIATEELRLTSGKHALDEVLDIAQYDTVPFRIAFSLGSKCFYLYTLAYWHRELFLKSVWVVEDGAG